MRASVAGPFLRLPYPKDLLEAGIISYSLLNIFSHSANRAALSGP